MNQLALPLEIDSLLPNEHIFSIHEMVEELNVEKYKLAENDFDRHTTAMLILILFIEI